MQITAHISPRFDADQPSHNKLHAINAADPASGGRETSTLHTTPLENEVETEVTPLLETTAVHFVIILGTKGQLVTHCLVTSAESGRGPT